MLSDLIRLVSVGAATIGFFVLSFSGISDLSVKSESSGSLGRETSLAAITIHSIGSLKIGLAFLLLASGGWISTGASSRSSGTMLPLMPTELFEKMIPPPTAITKVLNVVNGESHEDLFLRASQYLKSKGVDTDDMSIEESFAGSSTIIIRNTAGLELGRFMKYRNLWKHQ
jgi:hypothetical protein